MYELGTKVRVIKIGSCTVDPGNMASPLYAHLKRQLHVGGGSTVTLLRDEKDLLLIDTGYDNEGDTSAANRRANWQALRMHLALAGVRPGAITKVFVTHFHRDHCGGLEYLPRARWYCLRAALDALAGAARERFIPLDDGDSILAGAVALETPGHTLGHGSILWCAGQSVRIAVAGDAIINLAWLQSGYLWRFNSDFYNPEAARKSIARLLHESDIVIPGHGEPFFTMSLAQAPGLAGTRAAQQ